MNDGSSGIVDESDFIRDDFVCNSLEYYLDIYETEDYGSSQTGEFDEDNEEGEEKHKKSSKKKGGEEKKVNFF